MSDVSTPDHPITLPEKPALEGLEAKWNERWERDGTYRFDRTLSGIVSLWITNIET